MPLTGPTDATLRRLFAVSMNRCAYPGCVTPIVDPAKRTILADVCHIRARDERGPRHDPRQPDIERHGFDNLVLLCGTHRKFVDAKENLSRFTPDALAALKANHEREARKRGVSRLRLTEEQLAALQRVAPAKGGAGHDDFRQGVVRENGLDGPGAGITLVGTTSLPASVLVELEREQAFGGQGAGGAAPLRYCGRPVDADDLARGLRIGSLFLANSVALNNSLVDAAGIGWTFLATESGVPLRLPLVLVAEFGSVEPCTLLRFTIRAVAPSGAVASEGLVDVEVPNTQDVVKRAPVVQAVAFNASEFGAWTITVTSAAHLLATHRFEVRRPA